MRHLGLALAAAGSLAAWSAQGQEARPGLVEPQLPPSIALPAPVPTAPLELILPSATPPLAAPEWMQQDMPPAAGDPTSPPTAIPTPAIPTASFYALVPEDQSLLEALNERLGRLLARLDRRWEAFEAEFGPERAALVVETALLAEGLDLSGTAHPGVMPIPSLEVPPPAAPMADFVASARDETANLRQSMAGAYGSWRNQLSSYAANLDFRARSLMLLRGHSEQVAAQLREGRPVALHPGVRAELEAEAALLEGQFTPFAAHLELVEADLMQVYAAHWARLSDLSQRGARLWSIVRALHGGFAPAYLALEPQDPGRDRIAGEFAAAYGPLGRRLEELYGCILEIHQSALLPMRMTAGYPGLTMRFLAPTFPEAGIPQMPGVLTDVLPVPVAATPCHAQRVAGEIPQERPGFTFAEGGPAAPALASVVDEPEIVEADPLASEIGEDGPLASEPPRAEEPFPEDPPAIVEGPPTPEELPGRVLACRVNADDVVAYPRLTDALRPAEREPSRHEPPIAGDGVALQDGSFTHEVRDLEMAGPGMPMRIARSYRSTVSYDRGGLLGQGWSLNLDRRILPQPARNDEDRLLGMEDLAQPQPLLFQDGSGRSDRHDALAGGPATGWRAVDNWGARFRAHVTTYVSPPGAFWEVQRYILVEPADHPFGRHRNIDAAGGEALFYVLRDKDGAQQVFNCRGQLVLVLDRHDNRIVLEYGGQPDPLTQNPVLVRARDTAGRAYDFQTVEIGRAPLATHWFGQPLRLPDAPIQRLAGFTDFAGRTVRYGLAGGEEEPRLAEVIGEPGRGARFVTRYGYDAGGRLASLTAPRQTAEGGGPWLALTYDAAGRVAVQEQAGAASLFDWSEGAAAEQLPDGTVRDYALVDTGAGWAVSRVEVSDPDGNGGPWASSFAYNAFGQLVEAVLPRGNRTRYRHETANAPVTAGPVRNDGAVTF